MISCFFSLQLKKSDAAATPEGRTSLLVVRRGETIRLCRAFVITRTSYREKGETEKGKVRKAGERARDKG
jgi:hypothetical protein